LTKGATRDEYLPSRSQKNEEKWRKKRPGGRENTDVRTEVVEQRMRNYLQKQKAHNHTQQQQTTKKNQE
tara:strand:- start:128 stop:334 length:207 start_codon:yes stop_codon:yes gene_type:complete